MGGILEGKRILVAGVTMDTSIGFATAKVAQELAGRQILVNSVAPGFIDTDMTDELPEAAKEAILARIPLGRMGTPEEVAEVVTWLATSASYVHGTVIHVNGGMYGG